MKLIQFRGPFEIGSEEYPICTIEANYKIMIGIQIPFSSSVRYIEEDFYDKDILLDKKDNEKDKERILEPLLSSVDEEGNKKLLSFSYLEIDNDKDKVETPYWLKKQNSFSDVVGIGRYVPINISDISISGIAYDLTWGNNNTGLEGATPSTTISSVEFSINENNLLEFCLSDGQTPMKTSQEWKIWANRDLPNNAIIDILYE